MTESPSKIRPLDQLVQALKGHRETGDRIVFTNGCFDLLHVGHVRLLQQAKALGDLLIVALNSDRSVGILKGTTRPVQLQDDRAEILAALECVDYVTVFDEETPLIAIERLVPHVLVKGGDWAVEDIVGREVVEQAGGVVITIPYLPGASTTELLSRIKTSGPAIGHDK